MVGACAHAEPLQHRPRSPQALARRHARERQGQRDVLDDPETRKQVERLEDHADTPAAMPGQGDVDGFTAVGGEHSPDLRLSDYRFKSGARNRWHTHTTDQILLCTDGDGIIATDADQHDLTPGVIVLIPKNTRQWHGAKPSKDMTHWSILVPADTRIAD